MDADPGHRTELRTRSGHWGSLQSVHELHFTTQTLSLNLACYHLYLTPIAWSITVHRRRPKVV